MSVSHIHVHSQEDVFLFILIYVICGLRRPALQLRRLGIVMVSGDGTALKRQGHKVLKRAIKGHLGSWGQERSTEF